MATASKFTFCEDHFFKEKILTDPKIFSPKNA